MVLQPEESAMAETSNLTVYPPSPARSMDTYAKYTTLTSPTAKLEAGDRRDISSDCLWDVYRIFTPTSVSKTGLELTTSLRFRPLEIR